MNFKSCPIASELPLPTAFNPLRLRIARLYVTESGMSELLARLRVMRLHPLGLSHMQSIVEELARLDSVALNHKPKGRSGTVHVREWCAAHRLRTLLRHRLTTLLAEDGHVLPGRSGHAVFCGTELHDPEPELRGIMRWFPAIRSGTPESADWIETYVKNYPVGSLLSSLNIACMEL